MTKVSRTHIHRSTGEKIGYFIIMLGLILFAFSTIYPIWHVIMYSFSDSKQAMSGGLFFWPRGFSTLGYEMVMGTKQIWLSYVNSILTTIIGTLISLALSITCAYPLSRRRLHGKRIFSMLFFITMLFSGGLIPTYIAVVNIGIANSFWALVLPGCLSVYNMFILRNAMQIIPESLEESAKLEGANDFLIMARIIVPLCTPSIAAVAMFYGIQHWNGYMNCLLYTTASDLQVLPICLRQILSGSATTTLSASSNVSNMGAAAKVLTEETIKMTTVAVAVVPILCVYPFLQRFYTKGVVAGAVKG